MGVLLDSLWDIYWQFGVHQVINGSVIAEIFGARHQEGAIHYPDYTACNKCERSGFSEFVG